jgi:ribosome-binding protein aMBF1 (putative translation factor)
MRHCAGPRASRSFLKLVGRHAIAFGSSVRNFSHFWLRVSGRSIKGSSKGSCRIFMMINKRSKIKKTSNPIDKRVGRRLRMQRRRLGMSQRALGAALGLKFQQIQNYDEPDRIKPSAPSRRRFASDAGILLQRCSKGTQRPFEAQCCSVTYAVNPLPRHPRWYRVGEGVRANRYERSPTDCRSLADTDRG